MTRREAILLTSATLPAQRLTPVEDLVNTLEMEEMAQRTLTPERFLEVAGSDRAAFDRITFRPRMMVNTSSLDLTTELFGQRHFAPILVAPISRQGRYHPGAESEMIAGANVAKTAVIAAAETSLPREQLAAAWFQYIPNAPIPPKAQALVISAPFDWAAISKLRKTITVPMLVKGVTSLQIASRALSTGIDGIIISKYLAQPSFFSPIELLPAIAASVGNKVPIFIDGSIRRGSDILKALALGATAVLIGRPAVWGLAAYGARGVQQVLEQLQTELARDMAMCGLRTCKEATPQYVRIHER